MKRQRQNGASRFPPKVARSILERGARGEKRLVVLLKNGLPSAVWGFEEYLERRTLPKKAKPPKKRRPHAEPPDPLGAVDGEPPKDLTRESMYADEE